MPTYTFTITLTPPEIAFWFVQILFVLFVFLMTMKRLYKDKLINRWHMLGAVVPFVVGYAMDLIFSWVLTPFMYLDRFHFKSRPISKFYNYIGDLTFTYQTSYHYRPGEELKGIKAYRHKVATFWAALLNPYEPGHVE